jgi:hypothetical protein
MTQDRPDWQTSTNIEAQTLSALAVDVAAQTIGQLGIDIEAQTISDVGIDIQNQSVGNLDTAVQTEQSRQVRVIEDSRTANLPDGDREFVNFTPPAGTIWRVFSAGSSIASTGGGTNHFLELYTDDQVILSFVDGEYPGSEPIELAGGSFNNPGDAVRLEPAEAAAQIAAVQGIAVDETTPVTFNYDNQSGATNTGTRFYALVVEQVAVA